MTAKARRALMWGGMFLLAYAGGSWLGRFTVGGVSDARPSGLAASSAEDFWAGRDRLRDAPEMAPPVAARRLTPQPTGNHVCEGCDAGETRNRQLTEYLSGYYGSASIDEDALARDQAEAPRENVRTPALPLLPGLGAAPGEP